MTNDRQTQLLRDIAMLAQLACDSHKSRTRRVRAIVNKLAELENATVSFERSKQLIKHIRASSDATDADLYLDGKANLVIDAPFNIDLHELSRRVLW